ncbi:MAG: hypothetical protein QXH42_02690 [Thermoplasmata archaeon]
MNDVGGVDMRRVSRSIWSPLLASLLILSGNLSTLNATGGGVGQLPGAGAGRLGNSQ